MDLRYLRDLWTTVERVAGRVAPLPCRSDLGIVYTALHGTGYRLVPAILERLGFSNVTLVEEQCVPDGNFPTLEYPNPEDPSAFDLAIKTEGLAREGDRCYFWLPIRTVTGLGHASGTETDTNSLPATSSACFWSTLWWLTVWRRETVSRTV